MATKTQYLEFSINLTNAATVAANQATFPDGVLMAPDFAATTFSAPIQEYLETFSAPCVRSPWFWFTPAANYPRDVAQFSRKSGGWFGIGWLFGTTTIFKWVGKFIFHPASATGGDGVEVPVPSLDAMREAYWFDGFEVEGTTGQIGDSGASGLTDQMGRQASRHVDGIGLALRAKTSAGQQRSHQLTNWPGIGVGVGEIAAAPTGVWERVYFRVRKLPSTSQEFWRAQCSLNPQGGAAIHLTPAGVLAVFDRVNDGSSLLVAADTQVLVLDRWYKLDILYHGLGSATTLKFYLGSQLRVTSGFASGAFVNTAGTTHSISYLGSSGVVDYELDLDDWCGFSYAGVVPTNTYNWNTGCRVRRLLPAAFNSTDHNSGVWTGTARGLSVQNGESNTMTSVATATASAKLAVNVDVREFNSMPGNKGMIAAMAMAHTSGTGGTTAKLGHRVSVAGSIVERTITDGPTSNAAGARYAPNGLALPLNTIDQLEIVYTTPSVAVARTCYMLSLLCLCVGNYGPEDTPYTPTAPVPPVESGFPPKAGNHNAPYPESIWARIGVAPISPVMVKAGTYTGTGLFQQLTFRIPPHFIWIRNQNLAKAVQQGTIWSSAHLGAHLHSDEGRVHDMILRARVDIDFPAPVAEDDQEMQYFVDIGSANNYINAAGDSYQYIAFCDPGMRFLENGVFGHTINTVAAINALLNTTFNPGVILARKESVTPGGTTNTLYFTGPGNTAGATMELEGSAELAAGLGPPGVVGQVSSTAIHAATNSWQIPYSVFRNDDGSADPGRVDAVSYGTYIGDGNASRTINVTPATLKRPLWALFKGTNDVAYLRDPGNLTTGSNKHAATGSVVSTAITAGAPGAVTVGILLNASGIVYNYLVIWGGTTAGNGGWSQDGEFFPVEPDSPFDGPWNDNPGDGDVYVPPDPDPVDDGDPPPDPDPGPTLDDDCEDVTNTVCIDATTKMANMALARIGVSQTLSNVCTNTAREAVVVRMVYETCARTVLRDFPWPFATRYATLALASPQPTHADWQYQYRTPTDCIFERRLVRGREGAVNPLPPPFMLSSDSGGGLILTNQAAAVLEYTARPACVGYVADALFREALIWRLAAEIAPALTRMTDVIAVCLAQYDKAIEKAQAVIKPGVPGRVIAPAVDALDQAAACAAANLSVVNRALVRIGCQTIMTLTDQSPEATAAALIFEDELRGVLRDYPWAYATTYATLVLRAGTVAVPTNQDWTFAYDAPTDLVMARRLVASKGRLYDSTPSPFRLSRLTVSAVSYPVLYCNIEATTAAPLMLEYTARLNCAVAYADALFRDALSWRLAAALAPTLVRFEPAMDDQVGRGPATPPEVGGRETAKRMHTQERLRVTERALAMYRMVLAQARAADANEQQQEKPGDSTWILGRE